MRPNSPPRFFFPEEVFEETERPPPPREERFMRFRDAKFPLAGLMREEGGAFKWVAANKKT